MNRDLLRPLTVEEIERYDLDGVVGRGGRSSEHFFASAPPAVRACVVWSLGAA